MKSLYKIAVVALLIILVSPGFVSALSFGDIWQSVTSFFGNLFGAGPLGAGSVNCRDYTNPPDCNGNNPCHWCSWSGDAECCNENEYCDSRLFGGCRFCDETDSGDDAWTAGTCTDWKDCQDGCKDYARNIGGANLLYEYYCYKGQCDIHAPVYSCDYGYEEIDGAAQCVPPSCSETDSGDDPFNPGVCTDTLDCKNGCRDDCNAIHLLVEYYCEGGECITKSPNYNCPLGCDDSGVAGNCISGSCSDTGGGNDIYTYGECTGTDNVIHYDHCDANGLHLHEYYCEGGSCIHPDSMPLCDYGCDDANDACVSEGVPGDKCCCNSGKFDPKHCDFVDADTCGGLYMIDPLIDPLVLPGDEPGKACSLCPSDSTHRCSNVRCINYDDCEESTIHACNNGEYCCEGTCTGGGTTTSSTTTTIGGTTTSSTTTTIGRDCSPNEDPAWLTTGNHIVRILDNGDTCTCSGVGDLTKYWIEIRDVSHCGERIWIWSDTPHLLSPGQCYDVYVRTYYPSCGYIMTSDGNSITCPDCGGATTTTIATDCTDAGGTCRSSGSCVSYCSSRGGMLGWDIDSVECSNPLHGCCTCIGATTSTSSTTTTISTGSTECADACEIIGSSEICTETDGRIYYKAMCWAYGAEERFLDVCGGTIWEHTATGDQGCIDTWGSGQKCFCEATAPSTTTTIPTTTTVWQEEEASVFCSLPASATVGNQVTLTVTQNPGHMGNDYCYYCCFGSADECRYGRNLYILSGPKTDETPCMVGTDQGYP